MFQRPASPTGMGAEEEEAGEERWFTTCPTYTTGEGKTGETIFLYKKSVPIGLTSPLSHISGSCFPTATLTARDTLTSAGTPSW